MTRRSERISRSRLRDTWTVSTSKKRMSEIGKGVKNNLLLEWMKKRLFLTHIMVMNRKLLHFITKAGVLAAI